jgi:hypothetical protein
VQETLTIENVLKATKVIMVKAPPAQTGQESNGHELGAPDAGEPITDNMDITDSNPELIIAAAATYLYNITVMMPNQLQIPVYIDGCDVRSIHDDQLLFSIILGYSDMAKA